MPKDKNLDQDIDLKKYDDPTGVSLREMNFGLWLSENRPKIMKMVIVFLIALSAFFFIFSSYNYVIYFLSSDPSTQISDDSLPTSPRQVASGIEIFPVQVLASDDRYDLAVKLKNPNEKFITNFSYCFSRGGQDIACGSSFLLPSDEKYILALGQDLSSGSEGINFAISDIFWQRIDAHKIPSWADFSALHLNLPIAGLNFASSDTSGLSDKLSLSSLEFSIKNDTSYGYYEVPLNILLFSGSELVGVNRYLVQNFVPGDSREVKISWAAGLSSVNRAEVKPDINIIDDSVYLKYRGVSAD